MNFLAHLYLSGENADLKIGNFIADHIKGKAVNDLPEGIRQGVLLHREIDQYTDTHPIVLRSKERLRPAFRKYAPVITDIFYDHFLAANWSRYSGVSLNEYAGNFYKLTTVYTDVMPVRTLNMLRYMIPGNWLVSYASIEGIHKVLSGMSRRTTFDSGMENAAVELQNNYRSYEKEFTLFFEDLQLFAQKLRSAKFLPEI